MPSAIEPAKAHTIRRICKSASNDDQEFVTRRYKIQRLVAPVGVRVARRFTHCGSVKPIAVFRADSNAYSQGSATGRGRVKSAVAVDSGDTESRLVGADRRSGFFAR